MVGGLWSVVNVTHFKSIKATASGLQFFLFCDCFEECRLDSFDPLRNVFDILTSDIIKPDFVKCYKLDFIIN